jgi:hypothetical protein
MNMGKMIFCFILFSCILLVDIDWDEVGNMLSSANVIFSVAKGPKCRPNNSKGALQKFVRPEKLAAELSFKMPKKGRTFLKMIIHIKILIYLQKSTLHLLISLIFRSLCQEKECVEDSNISICEKIL